ncbi:HMGB13 [Symbiodinium natans]|uniref:HMGB13 protein n=1 Tax=Symbiodinium natans TaxID=878477 RepID=A0A812NYM5_9DINO|nr:HMGB13 [Symbiodinium natans]
MTVTWMAHVDAGVAILVTVVTLCGLMVQFSNFKSAEKYVSAANSARAAYQKAVQDFVAAGGIMPGAKPPRDPNIPKKPPNAFQLFMSAKRVDIAESLAPDAKFLIEAGRLWRDLGDDARAPYQAQADELKAAYAKKRKAYLDSGGVIPVRKPKLRTRGKKKTKRDPQEPKRPLSAYVLWVRENRPTIAASLPAGHRQSEVMKEAGQRWRALGEKQKAPYQQKAADLKAEYQKEMRKYEDFLRGS